MFTRGIFALAIALSSCTCLQGGVRLFENPKLPHRDRYVVFVDTGQPNTFYFLPLGIKPAASTTTGKPRFGLQHSGYSSQDDSGRAAIVTFTFQLAFSASDVGEIRNTLSDLTGALAVLKPLPGYQYAVNLTTAAQRKAGKPLLPVATGS